MDMETIFVTKDKNAYAISLGGKSNSLSRLNARGLIVFLKDESLKNTSIISYDCSKLIWELENETETDLSYLFVQEKVYDLKIFFQLISLAYNGDIYFPASVIELSQELNNRKLKCPMLETNSSVEDQLLVIRCCHHYLIWKYQNIDASNLLTLHTQTKAQYALYKVEQFGYRVNQPQLSAILEKTTSEMAIHKEILKNHDWFPGENSKKRYSSIINEISEEHCLNLAKTKNGDYSSSEKVLHDHRGIPFIDSYLSFQSLRKYHSTYLVKLDLQEFIYPHFNVLVSTGRTSSFDPNFQNFPKDQEFRKCFIPREDHVFLIADYSTVELCTLAQTCIDLYGSSRMADVINDGLDIHEWFASILLNKEMAAVTKEERSYAKACNFGFPGGLGTKQFLEYAQHTYGIQNLTIKDAKRFKNIWLEAFPEMLQYLSTEGLKFRGSMQAITTTGRIRAKCNYTQAKNFPFQGLAADGTKLALFKLIQQNFRVINYIHDEFVIELKDNLELNQQKALAILTMKQSMEEVCPNVEIKIGSTLSDHWAKA